MLVYFSDCEAGAPLIIPILRRRLYGETRPHIRLSTVMVWNPHPAVIQFPHRVSSRVAMLLCNTAMVWRHRRIVPQDIMAARCSGIPGISRCFIVAIPWSHLPIGKRLPRRKRTIAERPYRNESGPDFSVDDSGVSGSDATSTDVFLRCSTGSERIASFRISL